MVWQRQYVHISKELYQVFLISGKMECMLCHWKHDEKQCLILGEYCLAGEACMLLVLRFVFPLTYDKVCVKSTYLNIILENSLGCRT
jgi:hypothetical protein